MKKSKQTVNSIYIYVDQCLVAGPVPMRPGHPQPGRAEWAALMCAHHPGKGELTPGYENWLLEREFLSSSGAAHHGTEFSPKNKRVHSAARYRPTSCWLPGRKVVWQEQIIHPLPPASMSNEGQMTRSLVSSHIFSWPIHPISSENYCPSQPHTFWSVSPLCQPQEKKSKRHSLSVDDMDQSNYLE